MARVTPWQPMSEAPLGDSDFGCRRTADGRLWFDIRPRWLEGLTIEGATVLARYRADGDYQDRWVTESGRRVHLVQWRPALQTSR